MKILFEIDETIPQYGTYLGIKYFPEVKGECHHFTNEEGGQKLIPLTDLEQIGVANLLRIQSM